MSKFLNETGLSYFWTKVKAFIKSKYVAIGDSIEITDNAGTNNESQMRLSGTVLDIEDSTNTKSTTASNEGIVITNDTTSNTIKSDNITIADENNNSLKAAVDSIEIEDIDTKSVITSGDIFIVGKNDNNGDIDIMYSGITIHDDKGTLITELNTNYVAAPKFMKNGGTARQVLLADGSIATLNAANGIPKLDANGRIPLSQLGNLDTTLFQVVTALPTTGIKKNRIYLLKSSSTTTQNLYSEYIYTGDVSATYDSSKWEKLGEYKADIDLTPYSKKDSTVGYSQFIQNDTALVFRQDYLDGKNQQSIVPFVSQTKPGVMQASDKKALDTLTARYPLSIATFTASPSLVEVGVAADITFAWTFNNTDFHPITAQGIVVDGAASVSVANGTNTYKKTALAGATSATTKSATLTVNGSLTKSVNVTYHYPTYIGVVANGTSITETEVKGLTKSIEWGKGKTATLTQSNQQIVYAYPASYGDLTSIKDGNGFEGFAGYTKSTLTVGGQTYNVYKQTLPATASSKYTFA